MTTVDRPLRVIQWTTGNIGRRSLHAIIGRDDMELVGVYAHGADKVGVDAAELSGWPEPTGVTATNDIDALLALEARRLLLQPAVAEHRRADPAARGRRQRLLQRGLDHRRQAVTRGPGPHPKGLREGQFHDLRQRRPSRHDQHGRHGAVRLPASGSTRSASPSRWTARPTSRRAPRPRWASRRTPTRPAWPRACAGRARCSPSRRR